MEQGKESSICIKCNNFFFAFFSDEKNMGSESFNNEFLASENLKMFFKGINDFNKQELNNVESNEDALEPTPIIDCNYVDLNSFNIFKDDNKTFSIIHLNIASLEKHKDELEKVLSMLNFKFDLIGISEIKLKKALPLISIWKSRVIKNCLLQQNLIKVVLLSTLLSTMIVNQGKILMQLFIKLMHLKQSLWKLSYQIKRA